MTKLVRPDLIRYLLRPANVLAGATWIAGQARKGSL
jgi:hypothetical protein